MKPDKIQSLVTAVDTIRGGFVLRIESKLILF